MPDQNELTLDIEVVAETATVRCAGALTLGSASRFRYEVKRLLPNARVITVDLTGVTMMDSMGLGTLAAIYVSARSAGCELLVVNIGPRIRQLLSVARLLSLFEAAGQANVRIP